MSDLENKIEEVGVQFGMQKEVREKVKEEMTSGDLSRFIERIERLEEEKKQICADIREIYAEAKGAGFDAKVMRQVIKLRKLDPADRSESEFLRDEYKKLLGIE